MAALLLLALPLAAQELPALTGRVVDGANLIEPAAEAALTEKLASFEATSSDQIVVATVPDLQGYAIEEFGVALGRAWKIGQAGENNGVILLVSSGDRKVRIEVGYGLEGQLTDAIARTVIETAIVPRFKSGDYAGGIEAGVEDIVEVLSGNAAELEARAERNQEGADWSAEDTGFALAMALFILVWAVIIGIGMLSFLARIFGRKTGRNTWRWLGRNWTSTATRGSGIAIGGSSWSSGSSSGGSSGGGFSGGGGSFGGGGSSGSW
ncbi:hypothetical protein ASG43_15145 [Aureimonas sp. Leaf454]|uniref:TPM domain-containing protein n=1 Tax=Aureimonas sp. Leaf454 TaxID=1736381 RepID=UPI0006FDB30F|nr:TPM domain-containing protein [Aureimonas sp. Leaf454]KQT42895.1 hypothetical protein ASG43_15145 [Aureimonas sp. Leaf454]